jgi:hypothetical protein
MTSNTAHRDAIVGWAAAAKKAECSKAQVRRLVARGTLDCARDEKGRHVFEPRDLEALRRATPSEATPETAPEAAPALPSAEAIALASRTVPSGGEVAALVFAALDAGSTLTGIVAEHALEPSAVARLHREWRDLKEADLSAPSIPTAVADLQEQVEELEAALGELQADLTARLDQLGASLAGWTRHVGDNPLAGLRSRWACSCGSEGFVAARIKCTTCGGETDFGWHPEEEGR